MSRFLLRQLQNSVRITKCKFESINPRSLRLLGFLLLASFDIFGSTLRIVVNNSIIQEEWEKSGNIRNISVRLEGRVPHLNTDSSLLSNSKLSNFHRYFLYFHKLVWCISIERLQKIRSCLWNTYPIWCVFNSYHIRGSRG